MQPTVQPSAVARNTAEHESPIRRDERGAVLVLVTISMVVLLGFAAFGIDMGMRNQRLAAAQHAIDAAVLSGAQYLTVRDADYAGASARIKEIIRQNLGIAVDEWPGCKDRDHLEITVAADTECISFRRLAGTDASQTKHDIRVRLPNYRLATIFGSIFGLDSIDLAATAASNGNNCPIGKPCGSGPTTTLHVMTPEEAACNARTALSMMLDDSLWAACRVWFPGDDQAIWKESFCSAENVTFYRNGVPESWAFSSISRHLWYYDSICAPYITIAQRDGWVTTVCFATDLALVYSDTTLWGLCAALRPGFEPMASYLATTTIPVTTTGAPWVTAPRTASTTTLGVIVPTSLDLAS